MSLSPSTPVRRSGPVAKKARFMQAVVPMVLLASVLGLNSCKKKDRLTASTFNLSVSPPTASVIKNQALTLRVRNSSGNTSATWAVAPSTMGSLNTSVGPVVEFTALNFGDVAVSATVDGVMSNSQIAIVSYIPDTSNSNIFDVYSDNGLPTGSDVVSDIFTGPCNPCSFLSEVSTGYTPEGVKYQRATDVSAGTFWGVTLDDRSEGRYRDLSAYNAGTLRFAIRLGRALVFGETLRVELTDGNAVQAAVDSPSWSGFDRTFAGEWQEVSIPISSFVGVDKTRIRVPFAILPMVVSGAVSFDVDAVRWQK